MKFIICCMRQLTGCLKVDSESTNNHIRLVKVVPQKVERRGIGTNSRAMRTTTATEFEISFSFQRIAQNRGLKSNRYIVFVVFGSADDTDYR